MPMPQSSKKALKSRYFNASFLLLMIVSFCMGLLALLGHMLLALVLCTLRYVLEFYIIQEEGISFGWQGYSWKQLRVEFCCNCLAMSIYASVLPFINWIHYSSRLRSLLNVVWVIGCVLHGLTFAKHVFGAMLALVCLAYGITFWWAPYAFNYALFLLFDLPILIATCFMQHRKDMLLVAAIFGLSEACCIAGEGLNTGKGVVYLFLIVLLAWAVLLFRGMKRSLPPGLQGCKFVKLAHLRSMVAAKQRISRCQDLPADAFGDYSKATHLVIISHRWLHPQHCDIPTSDHPLGFRLETMVDRLETLFSRPTFGRSGAPFRERLAAFSASLCSGTDVVVFFDFMSIPQMGVSGQGDSIPRTADEDRIFRTALPNMGCLYSIFPVVVCHEVPDEFVAYVESGWCFCELVIATLGNKLSLFSPDAPVITRRRVSEVDAEGVRDLKTELLGGLESKRFMIESDREIVRHILEDFTNKRIMLNAIQKFRAEDLQHVLDRYRDSRLDGMLDQPVNANLDTPLHIAASCRFREGVGILLQFGADPTLRNYLNDRPSQWYMFPRVSRAAALLFKKQRHFVRKDSEGSEIFDIDKRCSNCSNSSLYTYDRTQTSINTTEAGESNDQKLPDYGEVESANAEPSLDGCIISINV